MIELYLYLYGNSVIHVLLCVAIRYQVTCYLHVVTINQCIVLITNILVMSSIMVQHFVKLTFNKLLKSTFRT